MSILKEMNENFKIEVNMPPSNEKEIQNLIEFSQIEIPVEFLEIIREQTEVEICINDKKYIRIWGAEGCIEMNEAYYIQENIPNSLAIGDDEGGNALIYANGEEGEGVYLVAFNDLEREEMKFISNSLFELFKKGIGINVILIS